jgi:TolA-binding protein
MSTCKYQSATGLRHLKTSDRQGYAKHLTWCNSCAAIDSQWEDFEYSLRQSAEQQKPQVTLAQTKALLNRAANRRQWLLLTMKRPLIWCSAAVAITILIVALFGESIPPTQTGKQLVATSKVISPSTKQITTKHEPGDYISAPKAGRRLIQIGNDLLGLSATGAFRLIDANEDTVRLELKTGTVACNVTPRKEKAGFIIEAGEYSVHVIGTRFSVTRGWQKNLKVTVSKGIVEVKDKTGTSWRVRADETLSTNTKRELRSETASKADISEIVRLLSTNTNISSLNSLDKHTNAIDQVRTHTLAESHEQSPETTKRKKRTTLDADLQENDNATLWRRWIVDGKFDEARRAISSHLDSYPSDGVAWSLLADLERKTGNKKAALKAYEKTIETAIASTSNRARYLAATIAQKDLGDHAYAVDLFEEFLKSNSSKGQLPDVARLGLSRSLIELGKTKKARAILEKVIENQQDTFVAANARRLLETI